MKASHFAGSRLASNHSSLRAIAIGTASIAVGAIAWEFSARAYFSPIRFPPLSMIGEQALTLLGTGELFRHVAASMYRVLVGFLVGAGAGVLMAFAIGTVGFIRRFADPIVNFLRFIPPIAWITPFIIWFGIGETSKILIVTYTVMFMVLLSTLAGIYSVPQNRLRAARCFGATPVQVLLLAIVPSTVRYILIGMRIGLANAFTTIVTAEMIAAQAGLGYIIIISKNYGATDMIFLGMITLGLLGLLIDRAFVLLSNHSARRFYLQ